MKDTIEAFMDYLSIVCDSFERCLSHLSEVLKRCEDSNLVLNWGKCYFMVTKVLYWVITYQRRV